jgi:hypothetical protein
MGAGTVVVPPRGGASSLPELLYLARGASEDIDWAVERALSRSFTFGSGSLERSDLVLVRLSLSVQANPSWENLTLRIRLGGLVGLLLLEHTTSSISSRDYLARMTVRSVGSPGSAHVLSGQELFSMGGMAVVSSVLSVDTTVPQELVVTASWDAVVGSPSARVETFEVWRHRPSESA